MQEVNSFGRATRGVDFAQRALSLPDTAVFVHKDNESYHTIRLNAEELRMISIALEMCAIACYEQKLDACAIFYNDLLINVFEKGGAI